MLTALQQRRLWELWFGGEVRAYYFSDLAARYHQRHRIVSWVTLFGASGALAAALAAGLSGTFTWVPAVVTLIPAGLGLYSVVADDSQRAADSRTLYQHWSALASQGRELWDAMEADEAPHRLADLEARARELSMAGMRLPPYDEARMDQWQAWVTREHEAARADAAA
jgi:hypothetical protein